jgi:hypothetical protein
MNVGWMTAYKGLQDDTITGGGEFVKNKGFGHEIFNFQPYKGHCYGYGRAANDSIAIERLGASEGAAFVDGVLVVWVANSHVVGWFKNARVYREWQSAPSGSGRTFQGEDCLYYAVAKQGDCKCLDPDARMTLTVPRARDVAGGMGRYVWYAEGEDHKHFRKKLLEFINSNGGAGTTKPGSSKGGGPGWQIDPRRRKLIEDAAVQEVMRYYKNELNYKIKDRQNEHCGWDLEATKDGIVLFLEVKGVEAKEIGVELTANEYKCMKKHRDVYRVCIVTNALSKTPTLSVYGYVAGSKRWEHHKDGTPIQIEPVWVETARLYL